MQASATVCRVPAKQGVARAEAVCRAQHAWIAGTCCVADSVECGAKSSTVHVFVFKTSLILGVVIGALYSHSFPFTTQYE